MNLIMQAVLVVLSAFSLGFRDNVHDYYKSYQIDDYSKSNEYELLIATGICDGEASFGVYFYPDSTKGYKLTIVYNNKVYELKSTNGQYLEGYKIGAAKGIKVVVLDGNYNKVEEIEIANTFGNLVGNDKGVKATNLVNVNQKLNNLILIYSISGGVILLSLAIILVLIMTHTGMFSKSKRTQEVLSVKEIIDDIPLEKYDAMKDVALEEEEEIETLETKKPRMLSQDELRQYLSDKGYILDYNLLSEEEKNKIMLDLMLLKNQNMISEETYKKEVVELWKK